MLVLCSCLPCALSSAELRGKFQTAIDGVEYRQRAFAAKIGADFDARIFTGSHLEAAKKPLTITLTVKEPALGTIVAKIGARDNEIVALRGSVGTEDGELDALRPEAGINGLELSALGARVEAVEGEIIHCNDLVEGKDVELVKLKSEAGTKGPESRPKINLSIKNEELKRRKEALAFGEKEANGLREAKRQ